VGLLGGIVARELEARTAQTAWSLSGSRLRWLIGQVAPILVVLGVTVTFAALAAGLLEANRQAWGEFTFHYLEEYGPLIVFRAFCAFGIGLPIGGLLGRTLPAFVLGAALSLALVFAVENVRLPRTPLLTGMDGHLHDGKIVRRASMPVGALPRRATLRAR
jgi:hypothetical protein